MALQGGPVTWLYTPAATLSRALRLDLSPPQPPSSILLHAFRFPEAGRSHDDENWPRIGLNMLHPRVNVIDWIHKQQRGLIGLASIIYIICTIYSFAVFVSCKTSSVYCWKSGTVLICRGSPSLFGALGKQPLCHASNTQPTGGTASAGPFFLISFAVRMPFLCSSRLDDYAVCIGYLRLPWKSTCVAYSWGWTKGDATACYYKQCGHKTFLNLAT